MSRNLFGRCLQLLLAGAWVSLLGDPRVYAAAGDLSILLSADTEGQVAPCQDCPLNLGGLARRATLVKRLRGEGPTLLLDAGNALAGSDSLASDGKVIVEAYNALGYDVLNLSYREFRFGKERTLAALKDARFAVVSANLLDEASGVLLARPYVVKEVGGRKIAVIGVTDLSAAAASLPHLKRQLAGVRIRSAAEALDEWLPKARAGADRVVLLFYGSATGLNAVREKCGGEVAAILVGGLRPHSLPPDAKPPLIGTSEHGKRMAQASLAADGNAGVRQSDIEPKIEPDPQMERLLAKYQRPQEVAASQPAARVAPPAPSFPATMRPGSIYTLQATVANRAVRLCLINASLANRYGEHAAPEGRCWLILSSEWESIISLTLIEERQVPTMYKIPNLGDHLYLVVNGSRLSRIVPGADGMAGHVPVKDFALEQIGSRIRGNILFEIPAEAPGSLELRFYDYSHGPMNVILLPASKDAPATAPLAMPQRNEVIEAALHGLGEAAEFDGQKAPPGMTHFIVDLRARSLFMLDADASYHDPKAPKGAKLKVGTVADWKESRKYIQLVLDGQYAYAPLEASELAPEPRFLPDAMTGGKLVFLAPAKRQSMELLCEFPNAAIPGTNKTLRPTALLLPLAGTRPPLAELKTTAAIRDDVFTVSVVGQSTRAAFAGARASAGNQFLVLDVVVENTGAKGEIFQTRSQLKHAAEGGSLSTFDPASYQGLRPPMDLLWVPAGQRRAFQVAYRIPSSERKPRLAYSGVSLAKLVPLDAVEPAVATTPDAPERPEPTPRPAPSLPVRPPAETVVAPPTPTPQVPVPTPLPAPARPLEPKGIAGVGLTAEAVDRAIDQGCLFLWNWVKDKDLAPGNPKFGDFHKEHLLCALALVHAGAHKAIPDFNDELRSYLGRVDPRQLGTYENGVLCMLVDAYDDPAYLPKLRLAARYLLEAQGPGGAWDYTAKVPAAAYEEPGAPKEGGAEAGPWRRLSDPKVGRDGDNSVSQFALLGLHSASRRGIKLSPETWQRSLKTHRERERASGGWCYNTGYGPYGSMTCAGICAVAINRHELGEKDPATDPAIARGLAWLDKRFSVGENPSKQSEYHYYYLYSLERVGRLLDTEFIGEHEWYPLGARYLVDHQQKDGRWTNPNQSEPDTRLTTSYALLFLTRGTPGLGRPAIARTMTARPSKGTLRTVATGPRGARYYIILDASASMQDEMDGKPKFDLAREAVASIIRDMPASTFVALRVYGHRKRGIDAGGMEDTELEIPMGRLDRAQFLAKLRSLRSVGRTPLALSLTRTAEDLADDPRPVTVILLTDGMEDTVPPGDPVKAADRLAALKHVQVQVVGFDIDREDWHRELKAVTRRAGGQYWPAPKAEQLKAELHKLLRSDTDDFVLLGPDRRTVGRGTFGDSRALLAGSYRLCVVQGGVTYEKEFTITGGATTTVGVADTTVEKAPTAQPSPPPRTVPPGDVTPANRFCTQCGRQAEPGAKFCAGCGAKLAP